MNQVQSNKQAVVVLIRGLPGSGKSTIVSQYVDQSDRDLVVLDPDATQYDSNEYRAFCKQQTIDGVDSKLHPYRFLRAQAYTGIENGQTVLWNQAFTNLDIFHKMVDRFKEHAALHDVALQILVAEVAIDPKIAEQRIKARVADGGHDVNSEKLQQFINEYRSFEGEGYRVVSLDGENDVTNSANKLSDAIEALVSDQRS